MRGHGLQRSARNKAVFEHNFSSQHQREEQRDGEAEGVEQGKDGQHHVVAGELSGDAQAFNVGKQIRVGEFHSLGAPSGAGRVQKDRRLQGAGRERRRGHHGPGVLAAGCYDQLETRFLGAGREFFGDQHTAETGLCGHRLEQWRGSDPREDGNCFSGPERAEQPSDETGRIRMEQADNVAPHGTQLAGDRSGAAF